MTNRPEAASTGEGAPAAGGWVAGGWVAGGWVAGGWVAGGWVAGGWVAVGWDCCDGLGLAVHENPSSAVTPSSANSRDPERLIRKSFKSLILTSPILISEV